MGDIFELHSKVMQDYRDFVRASVHIADPRLRDFVDAELNAGRLWPDVMVQVSPGYRREKTVEDLAGEGLLHPETAEFFRDARGSSFRLYTHQVRAIELAVKGRSFVLTSGTGSGKSLCFFLPIIDSLLRDPAPDGVTSALVVYPMNALVNSQVEWLKELNERYRARTGREFPVRFARYTGETGNEARKELRADPPGILLTNYMMGELMLMRPEDWRVLEPARGALRFLVFDELHTFRGRGGADVGMLIRRLKEHCAAKDPVHIGTSATMVSGPESTPRERREAVAAFAQKLFGCPFGPEQVVEESLTPVTEGGPPTEDELTRALGEGGVPDDPELFRRHPLARWLEWNLGIRQEEDGLLRRREPRTLGEAAQELAGQTQIPAEVCEQRLREALAASARASSKAGGGLLPFKLHQFISQGQPVQASLEPRESRRFSMEGQVQDDEGRLLLPVRFCRICGQDYYLVRKMAEKFEPMTTNQRLGTDSEEDGRAGYLMLDLEEGRGWSRDQLPPEWLDESGKEKRTWKNRVPRAVWVRADGSYSEQEADGAVKMWFQPAPFSLCQRCGEFYSGKQREFTKLGGVATEGCSTATSVLAASLLREATETGAASSKLLTFTDNRQDASLQAGHFNHFVRSLVLRSALCAALEDTPEMDAATVAGEVVRHCGLEFGDLAGNKDLREGTNVGEVLRTFEELMLYRLYDDLRRGWSVIQPNLELVGLLRIGYEGLAELCRDGQAWSFHPAVARTAPERREELTRAVLDEFRHQFAIGARDLQETSLKQLQKRCKLLLDEHWGLDEGEILQEAGGFVLEGGSNDAAGYRKLTPNSLIGKYLRRELALSGEREYFEFLQPFLDLLCRRGLLIRSRNDIRNLEVYRLDPGCIRWKKGDGTPAPAGLRSRTVAADVQENARVQRVNEFYQRIYREPPRQLAGLEAREHTAQVVARGDREERERRFRLNPGEEGQSGERRLPYLVCSPTMELGVDIAELELVHMRNVPPTPANYAQRSGRAGRQGQPGLIVTFCRASSQHDQYYFRNRQEMVAGAVRPPSLDLENEALLEAHIHAIWLAKIGLSLGSSVAQNLDLYQPDFPLTPEVQQRIQLDQARQEKVLGSVREVLDFVGGPRFPDGTVKGDEWLREVIRKAPERLDRAFDRWRELYRAAQDLKERARLMEDTAKTKEERDRARALHAEAGRQIDLLLKENVTPEESDFYPYRYLASEGFLPGYNFPSLVVRAWVNRNEGEFIPRARFIAIREYAPGNVLYHEGQRWRCISFIQPPGGLEDRLTTRRLCELCGGYSESDQDDVCPVCRVPFDPGRSRLDRLLEMPNVRTRCEERITSGEEDRLLRSYDIRPYFRYSPDRPAREAEVCGAGGSLLFRLAYSQAAELLRVNHGWRDREGQHGFRVDLKSGEVLLAEEPPGGRATRPEVAGDVRSICLFVRSSNNILRLTPMDRSLQSDEGILISLREALKRGMARFSDLEEDEVEAELLGEGDHRSILFYETPEGGVGVLRRFVEEADALQRVAAAALEVCHFDPRGNDLKPQCAAACYECLMNFGNQQVVMKLDRRKIRDVLLALRSSRVDRLVEGRNRQQQLEYLRRLTDSRSDLERKFLEVLDREGFRLPDDAQRQIPEPHCIPDFFYRPNVCVFCDGKVHDEASQREKDREIRERLRQRGYEVVVLRYNDDLLAEIRRRPQVFGPGPSGASG